MDEEMLPKFDYYLDESDPDILVLRRQDGAFVAAFSARGVTTEGIVEAAKEDYRQFVSHLRVGKEQEASSEFPVRPDKIVWSSCSLAVGILQTHSG